MLALSPESSALQVETPTISCVVWRPGPGSNNYKTSGACGNKLCELCRIFYAKYLLEAFEYFPPFWTLEKRMLCAMLIMQIYLQLSIDWIFIIVICIHISCLCLLRGISTCSATCVGRCSYKTVQCAKLVAKSWLECVKRSSVQLMSPGMIGARRWWGDIL